jgi:glycosyltransferase involved in cell wall biosynthesis
MKTQRNPLKIFLYCDGSELDGSTLGKKSLGGSETAGIQIAKALRDLGNEVTVFSECTGSNTNEGIYDGVEYISHKKYVQIATNTSHDVNIISRRHELLRHPYKSKINILWNQDHAWLNQKEDLLRTIWNCDSLFTLTECHNNQQLKVWELPNEFSWIAGNGVDLDLINDSIKDITTRDPNKLIYASRPERGLDVLVTSIFPNLLKLRPSLKLYITTYDYFPPQIVQLWNRLQQFSKQFGDSIVWLPPQKKEDLYRQFASSSLFLYPANHKEGYCIVAAEALACGLPIVANGIGALPEIVPHDAGCLLQGYDSNTNIEFQREFITRVLELLDNKNKWESASLSGKERAKTYDWKVNANKWDSKFRELISKKKENSLSVIITTKNNENTIESCLDSIKSVANEVIVYDSGSEDKTLDILESYNCKIIRNIPSITVQGKEAIRDKCLKECNGDWVLWMNPDEQLMDSYNIIKYLRNNPFDAYSIHTQFISNREYGDTLLENPVRLFRSNKDIKFYGLSCERPYKDGMKKIVNIGWISDVVLLNTNTDLDYQKYFSEEFPLLDRDIQKYPNRKEGLFYYIQGLSFLVDIAVRNRNYSQEVQSWMQKVIDIYRKHFLGKKGVFAQRALDHYSKMNKLTGNGLGVSWNIDYLRGNSRLNETGNNIQFSSLEDMGEFFDSFIKNRPEVLFDEYHLPGGVAWT